MKQNIINNMLNSLISYTPEIENDFILLPSNQKENEKKLQEPQNIFPSLSVNLDYMKNKYNTMINSDIIIREFILNARNKQYKAFLVYIDGMVDSNLMNDFILKPLMLRNKNNQFDGNQNKVISEAVTNNIIVRKIKKFDLCDYIKNCLLPQNSVEEYSDFDKITDGINSGNCALFVDTLQLAFDIEVKGFKQRSIDSPNNEIIIKGPQEAFVENIRTNTSLIRRIINTENLIIESIEIGEITKTKCAICYLKNITNDSLISEVKFRLQNLDIDSLLSAGELEQLISESNELGIPECLSTERPDKATKHLLEGRVVVIVNGTPYALIMPVNLKDFMSSSEDTNLIPKFGNFLRILRYIAAFITLLLPGLYIAITSFHQEILPTELLFSIIAARENVPFPVIFELIIMEGSFELIREAGLRVPSPIGPTIGIVGALVLGEAAVSAGIVSPILIIIVAITGISSFAIPDFSFGFHLRYYRFLFIVLAYMSGFLGVGLGIFIYISTLYGLKSFGIPFVIPYWSQKANTQILIPPIWNQEYRSTFLKPKRELKQEKYSMKWKLFNKE